MAVAGTTDFYSFDDNSGLFQMSYVTCINCNGITEIFIADNFYYKNGINVTLDPAHQVNIYKIFY